MTARHYPDVDPNPNFAALEQEILDFWAADGTFQKSIDRRPHGNGNDYVFYDGPPFANGLPHYGHLLTGYVKDAIARYQTMRGKRVERRFGWDCHGLPAEMQAEKELNLTGRAAIIDYGIDKFNEYCRTNVMRYVADWEYYVTRQGRWVDFKNDYKTMDKDFMESVLWAFSELHKKGLVYEAFRVMPYSWAAETPLSNFETRMDNATREREDKAAYVAFKLNASYDNDLPSYIVAWTTTPWTLPSNLALAVSPSMPYIRLVSKKPGFEGNYLVAESQAHKIQEALQAEQGAGGWRGSELVNLTYEPLFPYFADTKNAFRILDGGDAVTEGEGTGVIHMAPGFGEVDQKICAENGIEVIVPVDGQGKFTDAIYDLDDLSLKGLVVVPDTRIAVDSIRVSDEDAAQHIEAKDVAKYGLANMRIVRWLKARGLLVKDEPYKHNYPHCWRTDTPIIYRAMSSWYVAVTKFRERAGEINQNIHWIPDHVKNGQMGHMLATAPDWSISRNRFWGTPIPIWRAPSGKVIVPGSIAEIEQLSGKKVDDLHRPMIDDITIERDGETYTRVEDVFDCWFESGSMPYAQLHYPFENKQRFEENFPADFITEYVGQTRGWFNTLIMLSTALFDKEPFENCICHGVVIDEATGLKYSKKLKNYRDPKEVMDAYGADALRWMMLASPVMVGSDIGVDPEGKFIRDVVRLNIKPMWSAYNFFTLYANADGVRARNYMSPRMETERCVLRPFTVADEADYIALVGNAETMKTIGGGARSAEDAKKELAFIIEYQKQHGFTIWAVCDKASGKLLGKAGFTLVALDPEQPPQASLHYIITPEGWGKGLAKELAQYLVPVGFHRFGFAKIVAGSVPGNAASLKIIEGLGFDRKKDVTFRGLLTQYYELEKPAQNLLDRYILAKCKSCVSRVEASMDSYFTVGATSAITEFFDVLNNWYIRRSRPRFWAEETSADKQAAYDTLFTVLNLMCLAAAPLLPFTCEAVYRGLNGEANSVHLQDFPDVSGIADEDELVADMEWIQAVCNAGLAIRNRMNIRTRQPLESMRVIGRERANGALLSILLEEVNVKRYSLSGAETLQQYATRKLAVNSAVLGKRLPAKMKEILPASKKGEWKLLEDGRVEIAGEKLLLGEYSIQLEPKQEYKDSLMPLASNDGIVLLDLRLTPELEAEGRARDLVRMIQQARKDAGLHVADRIALGLDVPAEFREAVKVYGDYIREQTLAVTLEEGTANAAQKMTQELDGAEFVIGISKAA